MSIAQEYDVIVIGGGPAGMMAAGRAAERGLQVLLLEKNDVLGKKLSITGGGRCNVTHAELDTRTLLKRYGESEQFLYAPFSQFSVEDTFSFFAQRKLPLIIEEHKRAFPETENAVDVTRVMEQFIHDAGVRVLTKVEVKGFVIENAEVAGVKTDSGVYRAKSYVIATGGKSHPETGSTGECFLWLNEIGHTVHNPNPDLVPLRVEDSWIKGLSGTTLSNVGITFTQGNQKVKKRGDVLCTHFGISGPTIINSAHDVKELLKHGPVSLHIDLFPLDDVGTLRSKIQAHLETHSNKSLRNALGELLPASVTNVVLEIFPEEIRDSKIHSLVRRMRYVLVDRIKNLTATVTGLMGYERSIVSDGGVDLKEIDMRTMQSRLHKNVYLIGDVLNIKRSSGGFSLQLCWTTGWVAGEHVCEGGV